jgi:hypothetical protein
MHPILAMQLATIIHAERTCRIVHRPTSPRRLWTVPASTLQRRIPTRRPQT